MCRLRKNPRSRNRRIPQHQNNSRRLTQIRCTLLYCLFKYSPDSVHDRFTNALLQAKSRPLSADGLFLQAVLHFCHPRRAVSAHCRAILANGCVHRYSPRFSVYSRVYPHHPHSYPPNKVWKTLVFHLVIHTLPAEYPRARWTKSLFFIRQIAGVYTIMAEV